VNRILCKECLNISSREEETSVLPITVQDCATLHEALAHMCALELFTGTNQYRCGSEKVRAYDGLLAAAAAAVDSCWVIRCVSASGVGYGFCCVCSECHQCMFRALFLCFRVHIIVLIMVFP
jgi:hypothetical protein